MLGSRFARRCAIASTALVGLIAGAGAVTALSTNGSQQFSQNARGVADTSEAGDFFAASLAIGDFDNDGYGDVLAGAPFENRPGKQNVGMVHVLYGSTSGTGSHKDTFHQNTRGIPGSAKANDMFGAVVSVGDFDGDGYDDAAIGAPGEDAGSRKDSGAVTILYGSRRGLSNDGAATFSAATARVAGQPQKYASFGSSLAAGDFDGDGRDDLAVGAPGAGGAAAPDAGAVHVLFGSKNGLHAKGSRLLTAGERKGGPSAGDLFGAALAAGDFDGNGRDDLAVGVPGDVVAGYAGAGAVLVFDGSKSGLDATPSRQFSQNSRGLSDRAEMDDRFGASLASGDFDGNGRTDLGVGAPGEAHKSKLAAGKIHVLYGTRSGLKATRSDGFSQSSKGIKSKTRAGDEFGFSLVAGDFDGNGRADLAIGVPGERVKGNNGAGVVHILKGASKGIRTKGHEWFWAGRKQLSGSAQPNAGFSRALAAGDIDGDGREDLVIGAPGAKVAGDAGAGNLTVIFG